jgi:hypothetical protein
MPAGEDVVPWLSEGITGILRLAGWAHIGEGDWHGPEKKARKIARPESGTSGPPEILQGCVRGLWEDSGHSGCSPGGKRPALHGVLQEIEAAHPLAGVAKSRSLFVAMPPLILLHEAGRTLQKSLLPCWRAQSPVTRLP